jgi:hypothetical protein
VAVFFLIWQGKTSTPCIFLTDENLYGLQYVYMPVLPKD